MAPLLLLIILVSFGGGILVSGVLGLLSCIARRRLLANRRPTILTYYVSALFALLAGAVLVWHVPMGEVVGNQDYAGFNMILMRKSFSFGLVPGVACMIALGVCFGGRCVGFLANKESENKEQPSHGQHGPSTNPPPLPRAVPPPLPAESGTPHADAPPPSWAPPSP